MKALISGTFDPVTVGHVDLIRRAAALFDEVYAVVFDNTEKTTLFSSDERLAYLAAACRDIPNVKVDVSSGLLAAYTEAHGIGVIVRGIRDSSDAAYEISLAAINRGLHNAPETIFLPADPALSHISSTFARNLIRYGEPLDGVLPDPVLDLLKKEDGI